jgi:hypothetical protein
MNSAFSATAAPQHGDGDEGDATIYHSLQSQTHDHPRHARSPGVYFTDLYGPVKAEVWVETGIRGD